MTVKMKGEEHLTKVTPSEIESTTRRRPRAEALRIHREALRRASRAHAGALDDLVIATVIRQRDASDTGERIVLEDFMREEGVDPREFGLE